MNSLPADHPPSDSSGLHATPVSNDLRNPLWTIAIGMACFFGAAVLIMALSGCATQPAEPDIPPVVVSAPPPAQASPGVLLDVSRSPQELDQLVAPIALYPDELVAQVLAAATYPAEVVEAERWMEAHPDLKGDALAKAADTQPWDSSVKALVQFPPVLAMMDKNLSWTSSVGEAYMSDSQTVMDAVQQMRAQAQRAGNLQSTSQENVTDEGQTIVIEPADADVDPWLVYGEPLAFYPGWVTVPGLFLDGPGIYFGLGIGIGIFGGYGWGWHHWGADWQGHGIYHNHAPYVSHSPTFWGHRGAGGLGHPGGLGRPGELGHSGGFAGSGSFHSGAIPGGGMPGTHSGAFSGYNHGGVTHGFAARGGASSGGFHGGGFGGAGGHR
jgi:hypothetical protein